VEFRVPSTIEVGEHNVKLDGRSAKGELLTVSIGVRVIDESEGTQSGATPEPVPPAAQDDPVSGPSTSESRATTGVGTPVTVLLVMLAMLILALITVVGIAVVRRRRSTASPAPESVDRGDRGWRASRQPGESPPDDAPPE
jgi:hypothetical protein